MFKFQIAVTPRSTEARKQTKPADTKPQPVGTTLTTLQQRSVSGGGRAPVNTW